MKATKSLMMFVAAAAMMFASCGKENNNDNGSGNVPDQNNMASVGGLATPLVSELQFDDFGTANFNGMYINDADGVHVHFGAGIAWESLDKTIDLTTGHDDVDYWFRYEGWAENGCEFTQSNSLDGTVVSWLNQGERTEAPVFSNGTLTTARTETGYTLKIEGTLIDGTSVLIKMDVPFVEEIIPLTKNSIIFDGVKYEFTTTAQQNGGTGDVTWNSTGANNVSLSGTIYQGSHNLGIFLEENPTGGGYHFELNVDIPGLQLSYNMHNDQLTGTLNGNSFTSTPFTAGEASISAYYNQMRVTIIGAKLSDGKELKLFVDGSY